MGDFDEKSIEFYMKYYGSNMSSNGKEYLYSHSGELIEIGGDVCFNLNLKNVRFYTLYGSIIMEDEVFDELNELFKIIRYSPMNVSIMPKTGGLNNIKNAIGNDRFDTFACLLSHYYDDYKVPIINGGAINMTIGQRLLLAKFLDSYCSVFDYFEDIYGIEESFTTDLIVYGSHLITTKEQFFEYVKIALRFWNDRINQEKIINYLDDNEINDYKITLDKINNIIQLGAKS